MSKNKKTDLVDSVMKEIKTKKINIRSRYVFLVKKLGMGSGLVLATVSVVFFVNLLLYSMRQSEALEVLSFGKVGLLAFLQIFPYEWFVVGAVFFVIASIIIKQYDISYKKSFYKIAGGLLVLAVAAGSVMAYSGANEVLEMKAEENFVQLRPFYGRRGPIRKSNVVTGTVVEADKNSIKVSTDRDSVQVGVSDNTHFPYGTPEPGDYVRAVGSTNEDGSFEAVGVRRLEEEAVQTGPGPGMGPRRGPGLRRSR